MNKMRYRSMHPFRWRLCAGALVSVVAFAGLVSCGQDGKAQANGAQGTAPVADELPDGLTARAEHFWRSTVEDDWETLYKYRDPRDADKATLEQFRAWSTKNEPFQTQAFEIGEILTEGDTGWVHVDLETSMRNFPGTPHREAERWHVWRVVQGAWYPVPLLEQESYAKSPALRDAAQEKRLRERFEKSWQLRQSADWLALYELGDPRDRSRVPFDQFSTSFAKSKYLDAEVFWVEVIEWRGRVRLRFQHKLTDPSLTKLPPKTVVSTEDWVLHEDEWYLDLMPPEQ
ncbi:MAG: hypothetical protein GY715_18090 [Planctomycetes bacterium]|nr:hypothetical protein [Planctomycetota bacterium]